MSASAAPATLCTVCPELSRPHSWARNGSSGAVALPARAEYFETGRDLYQKCKAAGTAQQVFCFGYIIGIADVMEDNPLDGRSACIPRNATIQAERSVEMLKSLVDEQPNDHFKRRQLGEAMLESGHRDDGLRELEAAMVGFERGDELDAAASVADEIVRVDPESIRHHQKRVEYAFRTNERGRLIEAYLALADALFRAGQMEKSRAIYHRVIDLAPDDIRAQAALENFAESEPTPPQPQARTTMRSSRVTTPPAAPSTKDWRLATWDPRLIFTPPISRPGLSTRSIATTPKRTSRGPSPTLRFPRALHLSMSRR